MGVSKRLKVVSLNSHLICTLCGGYYVGATAIKDCLHTFCRSCILKYIQRNSFCPICEVQIHRECSKLWLNLRPDKTLQDLVYKMVPGLYQDEMRRRRQFYSRLGKSTCITGEESGFLPNGARFFSQDDSISLSLEYYNQEENEENQKFKKINEKSKRYLQCPAAVTIRHLKKFLRMKYGIGLDCWVDIIYNDECLPESFSLMDVAYTFSWKRTSPMRFSYLIYTKAPSKAVKPSKNLRKPGVRDEETKKSKSALEQQKQSEYLENFDLNPTNSNICKTQNCNKTNSHSKNNDKNGTFFSQKKQKKNETINKNFSESEEGSRFFQSSEDSETLGLLIVSEKEESTKENSEDSQDSILMGLQNRKKANPVSNFEEEAVDSFTAKKLLKNKHRWEEKKRKMEESSTSRRKSESLSHRSMNKKQNLRKRRKTIADEMSLKIENNRLGSSENDDEDVSREDLKSEALRKVFVTKEKPENISKRKEEEPRKKKRKKSKHHEEKMKKRKLENIHKTPSVLSVDKDALKLKVKLAINKSTESRDQIITIDSENESEGRESKTPEMEMKKPTSDKERLVHLRAVRHKKEQNKEEPKDFINAPPSLTISKVEPSEQEKSKSVSVESKPSLEIMLVSPMDKSKLKVDIKEEPPTEDKNENKKHYEAVDTFGVLDLSEKSTRTKDGKPNPCPPKEAEDSPEKAKKNTHQSILRIAQDLVSKKLAPALPVQHVKTFDDMVDLSSGTSSMKNLKTLSDTAVNILMATKSKTSDECQRTISESPPPRQPQNFSNSTNSSKDCEKNSELKIPMYPISRPNLLQTSPKLQESLKIKSLSEMSAAPLIIRSQNQTVRQIPDPFMVLNRQNQNQGLLKPQIETKSEDEEDKYSKMEIRTGPPFQSIKKTLLPRKLDLPDDEDIFGLKTIVPNIMNNNTKTLQHSESNIFGLKNGEERKGMGHRVFSTIGCIRKVENLSKTIESVAAGLTARAVSNAIDAK